MWSPRHGCVTRTLLLAVTPALPLAAGCFVDVPPALSGGGSTGGDDPGEGTGTSTTTATTGDVHDDTDESSKGCPTTAPPGKWYLDQDGDDWGVEPAQIACDKPPGTSAERGDCDDHDPERFPGSLEVCDGEDDDCDEIVDEFSPVNHECNGCALAERDGAPHWFCKVDAIDWVAARAACSALGWTVDLLSIHGEADDLWARAQVEALYEGGDPMGTFWIGLRRADPHWTGCEADPTQWEWSDGSPVDYSAWSMGQPDSASCDLQCEPVDALDEACPRENCGQMFYMLGGWNDRACFSPGVGYACRAAPPP